jgi:hypothetical protein
MNDEQESRSAYLGQHEPLFEETEFPSTPSSQFFQNHIYSWRYWATLEIFHT